MGSQNTDLLACPLDCGLVRVNVELVSVEVALCLWSPPNALPAVILSK